MTLKDHKGQDADSSNSSKELLDRKNKQVAELRAKLLDTRRILNANIERVRAENRQLRRRLALYERRHQMKNVDAVVHNSESSMDAFFAQADEREPYVRFGQALRVELRRRGISLDGRRILDVGVGPGIALKELLRGSHPKNLAGFDFSRSALERARLELPEGEFDQRDVYLSVPGQYDVILCTEVLEHLEDPAAALRNMASATAPAAHMVVTVPDGRIDFSDKHINFWSPESWEFFLAHALPEWRIKTSVFQPYPETGHQTNLAILSPPHGDHGPHPVS